MTEPTDAPQPDPGPELDPELTTDLTAALGGATSFFPPAEEEPAYAVDTAEHEVTDRDDANGDGPLAVEAAQYEELGEAFQPVPVEAPLAPSEPAKLPGEPGTAGAALADLAGGYGGSYEPYYGTPSPWSSDRLEAIMRDTVDAQVQEQRQLETLLEEVREALTHLAASPPSPAAGSEAVDRLAAEVAAGRAEQQQQLAALTERLDALAAAAPDTAEAAPGPSIQDLHDGLAGVRTDMTSLPEQIGPAVTSAVAHGLAETTNQVGSLRQSLADTVAETTELRSLVAAHADHLGLLPEAVGAIHDLTARIGHLEAFAAAPAAEPAGPAVTALVEEQLEAHLERFGTEVTEQLNAIRAQVSAVEESLVVTVRERMGAFEERLDALHEVLVALHGSQERGLPSALVERLDEFDDELRAMRLANEGPTSAITSVVAQLHASEQRLAHHVDEAVLALAQAVLRRRAGGTAAHQEEVAGPPLPADELAAAARDDVRPDPPAPVELPAAADEDEDEAWGDDADGTEAAPDEDEAAGPGGDRQAPAPPGLDVMPGEPSGPDPRRGLFRRRP